LFETLAFLTTVTLLGVFGVLFQMNRSADKEKQTGPDKH
jgi:hypothetical protein